MPPSSEHSAVQCNRGSWNHLCFTIHQASSVTVTFLTTTLCQLGKHSSDGRWCPVFLWVCKHGSSLTERSGHITCVRLLVYNHSTLHFNCLLFFLSILMNYSTFQDTWIFFFSLGPSYDTVQRRVPSRLSSKVHLFKKIKMLKTSLNASCSKLILKTGIHPSSKKRAYRYYFLSYNTGLIKWGWVMLFL